MTLSLLLLAALTVEPDPTPVPDFTLTERGGAKVTRADMHGKVWVASFVMTRCPDGKCPQVTRTLQRLQGELANRSDVVLVTITSDPDRDDPAELTRYADAHDADAKRWLFLTGDDAQIDALMRGVYLRGGDKTPGRVDHAQKLVVINRRGEAIGYYDGLYDAKVQDEADFERNLLKLRRTVDKALIDGHPLIQDWMPRDFPAFNAALNALATLLLVTGFYAIKLKWVRLHVACMLTTIGVSAVFLASYLFFHIVVKEWRPTRFADAAPDAPAWAATTYGVILLSHTILAVIATPMALVTAYLGLREKWSAHVKLARWTFPIWLYVSVTGVVVYMMLYRLFPGP